MNYPSLTKIFPDYFRIVGYVFSLFSFSCAIVYKVNSSLFQEVISLRVIQTIFFMSLFFIVASRSKTEDERTTELRMLTTSYGFFAFIFFLIAIEIISLSTNFIFSHRDILDGCLVYLLGQTLLFEIFNRTTLIDKIESNKEIFGFAALILFIFLLFFNKWFWNWTYPSIAQ